MRTSQRLLSDVRLTRPFIQQRVLPLFSAQWVALNRSPSDRVNRILTNSRHPKHTLGRPHSAEASFLSRDTGDRRNLEESKRGWGTRKPEQRGKVVVQNSAVIRTSGFSICWRGFSDFARLGRLDFAG